MTSSQKTSSTATWDYQTVRKLIHECLKPKFIEFGLDPLSVDDHENLLELGVLDSFGIVELIAEVETLTGLDGDLGAERLQVKDEFEMFPSITRLTLAFVCEE